MLYINDEKCILNFEINESMMINVIYWILKAWNLQIDDLRDSRVNMLYASNSWAWLMKIITSRWLMLYDSIYVFMFFMSNSSFYMFLLTYMYQKLKNIKNIYIFKKSLRDSLPNRELLKMVAPAPAPRSRSRSQVTLPRQENHSSCP